MIKQKKPRMIYVKWLDTASLRDGWSKIDYENTMEGVICETVGWLVWEKKNSIYIAGSVSHAPYHIDSTDTIVILKSIIKKRKFLT